VNVDEAIEDLASGARFMC